jgi:predicted Zn-dependent protease
VIRSLAEGLERRGNYAEARELLGRGVARNPLDAYLRVMWAEALWKDGDREAALAHVQQAVQLDPGYAVAWDCLNAWCDELHLSGTGP